jgi:proline racemase
LISKPRDGTGVVQFKLEAPGGIIDIRARCEEGAVTGITLRNMPSFVAHRRVLVRSIPDLGDVTVDIAFGGMWYCIVHVDDVQAGKLALTPENGKVICRWGEMIKAACRRQHPVNHPSFDYPGVDIMVFRAGRDQTVSLGSHAKNAVVMSNGKLDWAKPETWTAMLDRSPCGTGTCAVMALLHSEGSLKIGEDFVHESVVGTQFQGKLVDKTKVCIDARNIYSYMHAVMW